MLHYRINLRVYHEMGYIYPNISRKLSRKFADHNNMCFMSEILLLLTTSEIHTKLIFGLRVKNLYCTMFWLLDQFWPPIVPYYSTEDAVRIGNSFISIPITTFTTFTHNYFLRFYTCAQLTITYTFVTTITCSTPTRLHSLRALHYNLYCTIAHKVS
jgi:hypothetical protein